MKFLYIFFHVLALSAALLFYSCGKNENKTSPDAKKDSTETKTAVTELKNNSDSSTAKTIDAGIKDLSYETGTLPPGVKYDGKVVAGANWEDGNGKNILVVTETEEKKLKEDFRMKELFAYQYIVNGNDARLLWKVNDFIKDCPVDITLSFMPKSLSVTDLDKNGIAENIFIYKMSCKGDVSPDDMKLIMHEGATKYAIRGIMILEMEGQKYGGEMKPDASFDNAPKEFLTYAIDQWSKFKTEKFNN